MKHFTTWLSAITATLFLWLGAGSTAVAASTGYGAAQGVGGGGTPDPTVQLPFTGLDMAPLLVAGLVLLFIGVALARIERKRSTHR